MLAEDPKPLHFRISLPLFSFTNARHGSIFDEAFRQSFFPVIRQPPDDALYEVIGKGDERIYALIKLSVNTELGQL
jgi:hypothetical protein